MTWRGKQTFEGHNYRVNLCSFTTVLRTIVTIIEFLVIFIIQTYPSCCLLLSSFHEVRNSKLHYVLLVQGFHCAYTYVSYPDTYQSKVVIECLERLALITRSGFNSTSVFSSTNGIHVRIYNIDEHFSHRKYTASTVIYGSENDLQSAEERDIEAH